MQTGRVIIRFEKMNNLAGFLCENGDFKVRIGGEIQTFTKYPIKII